MTTLFEHQDQWNDGEPITPVFDSWYFTDGMDVTTVQRMWGYYHSPLALMHTRPIEGAINTLNECILKHNVYVLVLTDRPKQLQTTIRDWLLSKGLTKRPNAFTVICTSAKLSKKSVVGMWNGYDEFRIIAAIDDAPHHIEDYNEIDERDFDIYTIEYPYNTMQVQKGLAIATTWDRFTEDIADELS